MTIRLLLLTILYIIFSSTTVSVSGSIISGDLNVYLSGRQRSNPVCLSLVYYGIGLGNGTVGGILRTYRGLHTARSTYSLSDKNFLMRSEQGKNTRVEQFLQESARKALKSAAKFHLLVFP